MKKYLALCLLVCCVFCGCATLKEGTISNNIFSSSFLNAVIKVDDTFSYLGEVNYGRLGEAHTSPILLKGSTHFYLRKDRRKQNKASDLYSIKRTEGYFLDFIYNMKDPLEHGEYKLGGGKYQYVTDAYRVSQSSPITQYILDKGYIMPDLIIKKQFARISARNDTLLEIAYLEDFSDYCEAFRVGKRGDPLTPDQQTALDRFNENCMNSFTVLK